MNRRKRASADGIIRRCGLLFLVCGLCVKAFSLSGVRPGADDMKTYLPLLENKRVGLLVNQTSMVGEVHLVDTLNRLGIDIVCILAPEHGFRGDADAGSLVGDGTDARTGIPVVSLYGASKKPSDSLMRRLDAVVFDLQDVGVRFYTYLSTLHYLLEAAGENGTEVIILDRPNPNGFYVDGPVLDLKHRSFVGIYPVPVVHGMTLGELAGMARGEGWVSAAGKLTVIRCLNYTHDSLYRLPVKPSPNLPDMVSVYLYPSLCFFEATPVSIGRGTRFPFKVYGHPDMKGRPFVFTPRSMPGAQNPPQKDCACFGVYLGKMPTEKLLSGEVSFEYLIDAYRDFRDEPKFFTSYFEKLTGVDYVRQMIREGKTADEIRTRWRPDVERFKKIREKYLLYE